MPRPSPVNLAWRAPCGTRSNRSTAVPGRSRTSRVKLIESHYENNYGGALRRLNAITEQLESLDFANTPGYVLNGLKREELVALNSTLLHELYFASLGGDGQADEGA